MPPANQDQHQGQLQAEAQLQGQLQGQGQGQHQGQSSESHNANGNGNGNLNGNLNGNGNLNLNGNENTASNAADNTATNSAVNESNTTVTVDVGVTETHDMSGYLPTDDDFADIDLDESSVDNILMTDDGDINFDPGNEMNLEDMLTEALNGNGNDVGTINAQSNNLVDNDVLETATVDGTLDNTGDSTGGTASSSDGIGVGGSSSAAGDTAAKSFWGEDEAEGSVTDDWGSDNGDDGFVSGESLSSAASTIDTTAFNQSIVMGANVLGNTVDMSVVGGNMNSTYTGDDSADGA